MSNRTIIRNRKGLTLIELVVVMTILVALAGLLVPTFASMLTRGHTSTCSTNIGESDKAVQEYQQLYGRYPNNLDALGNGSTLINYFAGGALNPGSGTSGTGAGSGAGGQISAYTLTQTDITNLSNAGITAIQSMTPAAVALSGSNGFDPTFNYYSDYASPGPAASNSIPVAVGTTVAQIDPTSTAGAAILNKLNLPLTGTYVVFGIGQRCDMVGKTIATAPLHYGDTVPLNPEYGYERLVCVFKTQDSAAGSFFTTAQLVAVGPIHDTGLGSINDELQNWYQLENNGS